jgi:thiamine transport system substrate-binding protein
MFVFPVNENAELPEAFVQYAELSEEPASVDPAQIDANREQWIEAWTDTVLR